MIKTVTVSVTDHELHALLDHEMDRESAAATRALVMQDRAASARLAAFRAQTARLQMLFEPLLDEAIPERMLDLVRGGTRAALAAAS